ncbi:protein-L-isoaspartate(D-aspartate) O-methyltransferase [candidate division KSB1 bacterium]|nr:protein-L-isoaspartate(D-aspartate) O-methyltransferase [candidate division KSB1 bacterium]
MNGESKRTRSSDPDTAQQELARLRNEMVEKQLARRGIKDRRVLDAMRKVPRHEFVPKILVSEAYDDKPLPIGERQTISQPYIVGFMTEQLRLTPGDTVLEIGTGSGYQAAILAEIVSQVYSIEIIERLYRNAGEILKRLGYKNITLRCGDGYQGWLEKAPYDAIIVTAAPDHIPQPLIDQLNIGGRMIIPVGDYFQELVLLTKNQDGSMAKSNVLPVRFVPMTGEAEKR